MTTLYKTDLSKYITDRYDPGGNTIKMILWYFVNVIFFINPLNPVSSIKVSFLRFFGAKVGSGVNIKPSVNIKYPWRLFVGDNVWIGENVWIDNLANVSIGNNCSISQGAMLLCGNHDYKKETFDLITKEITLQEGVWIGARSTVCPGIICESHSVLAVGSIATANLKSYTIYSGNPAIEIRKRIINCPIIK